VVHPATNLNPRSPRHDPCYPNIVTSSCLARMRLETWYTPPSTSTRGRLGMAHSNLTSSRRHAWHGCGALYTAYDLAVYASPLRLSPRRKTRFRLAATLDRSGFQPAGFVQEVSALPLVTLDSRHLFPLLQASPGARLARMRLLIEAPMRRHALTPGSVASFSR
jgi:hypothetical protein